MPRKNSLMTLVVVMLTAIGCGQRPLYSHFEHIPPTGWQRNDTLHFSITQKEAGTYGLRLSLRATSLYPFTELALVVERRSRQAGMARADTLFLDITDEEGNQEGAGISLFSYDATLTPPTLESNDTLTLSLRHIMTCDVLPGIADIGITLTKNGQ